jgi:1-deoxy-D-xylulose-5-phosphate reductoisomerase
MKNVVLLGSTGSIGTSTVKVAEDLPDRIRLIGLAAGHNARLLLEQARRHQPAAISIQDPTQAHELARALGTPRSSTPATTACRPPPPSADIV